MRNGLKIRGRFYWTLRDKSGVMIAQGQFPNGMTTVGLNAVASVELAGGSQISTWYMGLIDNAGFASLAAADTMASHIGWSEMTNYAESVRQTLSFGSPSGGIIQTSAACAFTISGSRSVIGAFVVSNSTKGGTTGILRAHGQFSSGRRA